MSLTEQQDPMSVFVYALKAPESRRQYPRRFKMFLDFLKLQGTIEEHAWEFHAIKPEEMTSEMKAKIKDNIHDI